MATTAAANRIGRRRSNVHGLGVFAVKPIAKNTRIIEYAGEKISHQESVRRERRYMKRGQIWCFQINRRWVRDAAIGGNLARFINHSCRPNCYVQIVGDTIWIRAARNIRAGEELTYDYFTDGQGSIHCRCRRNCQRLL
jgi:SET domain-containing protein